jgi:hypothetical protein
MVANVPKISSNEVGKVIKIKNIIFLYFNIFLTWGLQLALNIWCLSMFSE